MKKLNSRKFWFMVGSLVITLAAGLGFGLDPKWIAFLTSAEVGIWVIAETVIDGMTVGWEQSTKWKSRKFIATITELVILVALGIGYEIDKAFLAILLGADGLIWFVAQTILDSKAARAGERE